VLVDEATLWLAILLFGDAVHSRRVLAHQQRLLVQLRVSCLHISWP
jgi:hypothetical protein